jgi:pimeloyl-ACP methyl ester carboxylesterase
MKHLVFLHGFLENSTMWQPVLDRISKSTFKIHFPEIPGHGKNLVIPENHDVAAYADNIMAQLDIPENEKFIFIGHSMGGYIGAEIARRYGHRIKAFCSFHSRVGEDSEEKKETRNRAIEAARENRERYIRMMMSGVFHPEFHILHQDKIDKQLEVSLETSFEAIEAAQTVMRTRPDAIDVFKNRDFSLFYFLGDTDSSLTNDVMEEETSQLPGAAVLIAQNTGHMGHIECPQLAGEFVQRMLRSIDPS